ncbi:MAG: ATP synthase F1 subunit gamma [Acidimicrobiales bacterium]
MASGRERVLRRRIRSIDATKKITHAMELIAASQILRAQNRIARNRPYLSGLRDAFRTTVDDATEPTRLVGEPKEIRRVKLLLMVSDRGLAGAYNSSVLRAAERRLVEIGREGAETTLVAVGRRADGYFRFRGVPIEKTFQKVSERPSFDDARQVSAELIGPFMKEEVDAVEVVSTRFRSAGVQVVETRRLLPVPEPAEEQPNGAESSSGGFYDFEPRSDDLLSSLVPQLVEAEIFAALLEAAASEHTARQRAMAAATDNADELVKTLRREMNRVRQDAITSEILEIVGGAEALRSTAAPPGRYDLTLGIEHEEPDA